MLSRRHLRIKIFQALYAYFKGSVSDIALGEKELFNSVEKNYELFIYQLSVLLELRNFEAKLLEERKSKRLPSEQDLNPNTKFIDNRLLKLLDENASMQKSIKNYNVNWSDHQESIKKIYKKITETASFQEYMSSSEDNFDADAAIVIRLFKNQIADHEILQHIFEEKNIHWYDDHYFVCGYAVKVLKSIQEGKKFELPSLFKDEDDDIEFVKTLYRQVLVKHEAYEEIIMKKAQNWESDRIAIVDFILMKMAICELENMNSIPIKVSLNEYIEISKLYSTPKSRVFINGVLDKLVAEMKREGKIKKTGRGLIN